MVNIPWVPSNTILTGIAVVGGFTLLYIAIQGIETSQQQLNYTATLTTENREQLETLNNAVKEIAHQTIMQAYLGGKPYSVEVPSCNYDEPEKKLSYRLMMVDKEGTPSTINFQITKHFVYYTVDQNDKRDHLKPVPGEPEFYEAGKQKMSELNLSEVFTYFSDAEHSSLYIKIQYFYAPFSEVKNAPLSDDIIDNTGHLLIGFTRNENTDNWKQIENNDNLICQ